MQREIDKPVQISSKWKESESGLSLELSKPEGEAFLAKISGCFEPQFQKLIAEINSQTTGNYTFWQEGKRTSVQLPLKGSEKFPSFSRLWILFYNNSESSWRDQTCVVFDLWTKDGHLVYLKWSFENHEFSLSREVPHNRNYSTPSFLTISVPGDYSGNPDIIEGLRTTEQGGAIISHPFVPKPEDPDIVVPLDFNPTQPLLPIIFEDIELRGKKPN